jgi:DnaJ-class molecular chaperone
MNLYDTLKLQKGASAEQIREAYKTLVRKEHPDKGGDAETFKKIQKAYDILKDDDKRAFYDQTGQIPGDSPEGGMGNMPQGFPFGGGMGGGIPVDIHNLFGMFGRGGGGGGPRKKRQGKAPPRTTQIPLTLRDFYQGRIFRVQLERQRCCKDCKGEGSTSMKSCDSCNGVGTKTHVVQMGPFMMQNQGPCEACRGAGKQKGDPCWTCKGAGMNKEEKSLEVRIEPGMGPGTNIVFSGESSDSHDYTEAGDVIIELQEADEETSWIRLGDDLQTKISISYSESLVGCIVRLENHPGYTNGIVFTIPPGTLNTENLRFKGYGMPKRGSEHRGDAILVVNINKPSSAERDILKDNVQMFQEMFGVKKRDSLHTDHVVT